MVFHGAPFRDRGSGASLYRRHVGAEWKPARPAKENRRTSDAFTNARPPVDQPRRCGALGLMLIGVWLPAASPSKQAKPRQQQQARQRRLGNDRLQACGREEEPVRIRGSAVQQDGGLAGDTGVHRPVAQLPIDEPQSRAEILALLELDERVAGIFRLAEYVGSVKLRPANLNSCGSPVANGIPFIGLTRAASQPAALARSVPPRSRSSSPSRSWAAPLVEPGSVYGASGVASRLPRRKPLQRPC